MKQFLYKGQLYNAKELSEMCGIKYTTLIERLNRGYSVEEAISDQPRIPESVEEFINASNYKDWHGMTNENLYKIYRKWCLNHELAPESSVHFTRSIKRVIPNLRVVPSRVKHYGDIKYKRVIRIDSF